MDEYEAIYRDIIAKKDCLDVKSLAVNGADLLAAGVPQGRQIGEYLHRLLELVIEEPSCNTKEFLIGQVEIWRGPA